MCRKSCVLRPVSLITFHTSSVVNPVFSVLCPSVLWSRNHASCCPASCILLSCILHPAVLSHESCCPASCLLRPVSCVMHLASYFLCPSVLWSHNHASCCPASYFLVSCILHLPLFCYRYPGICSVRTCSPLKV